MFWNKRRKCPIDNEDQSWIRDMLEWIDTEMFPLESKETILPLKSYISHDFRGVEQDAEVVLQEVAKIFDIPIDDIELGFYSEEPLELDRGLVTKTEDGKRSAGLYYQDEQSYYIDIEVQQLKRPHSLITTMAHELSHYVLIGLNDIYTDTIENEWLTDLFTIANGFGIFMGNTKFEFSQWSSGDGWGGWSYRIQGYLPQQIIGYAMAEIEIKRSNSIPDWTQYMRGDFSDDFTKSMKYLLSNQYI